MSEKQKQKHNPSTSLKSIHCLVMKSEIFVVYICWNDSKPKKSRPNRWLCFALHSWIMQLSKQLHHSIGHMFSHFWCASGNAQPSLLWCSKYILMPSPSAYRFSWSCPQPKLTVLTSLWETAHLLKKQWNSGICLGKLFPQCSWLICICHLHQTSRLTFIVC